jgi:hypothetical protein
MHLTIKTARGIKTLSLMKDAIKYRCYVPGWSARWHFSECLAKESPKCVKNSKMVAAYAGKKMIAWVYNTTGLWYDPISPDCWRFTKRAFRNRGISTKLRTEFYNKLNKKKISHGQ